MHDDTQPSRVYEMAMSLRDGQFPVRWVDGLGYGYGYPLYNFYAPLPYYFGSIFILTGFDVLTATKIMFGTAILLAGFSMYFLAKKIWGSFWGGMIAAVFYVYAPYHAVEIYIRGAVGEFWGYAILPLVFYGILESRNNYKKGLLIGILAFAAIILSHNILGYLCLLFLFLWLLVESAKYLLAKKQHKYAPAIIFTILAGLSVSAFFWLPAVFEASHTKTAALITGTNDYHRHFVYPDQLWDSLWGFAGSAPGRTDGMSFKIGKLHLIIAALVILNSVINTLKKHRNIPINKIAVLLSGLVFSITMMLPFSAVIWELLPYSGYIQYPWRYLVFADFFVSLMGGAIVLTANKYFTGKVFPVIISGSIVALTLIFNIRYFHPQFYNQKNASDYISDTKIKWDISRISDEYLPKSFPIPVSAPEIKTGNYRLNNDIIVEQSEFKSHFAKINISAKNQAEIIFYKAYFPGWQAVIDTNRVKPEIKDGFISVQVPEGRHIITLFLEDTFIRNLGNIISGIGILIVGIIFLKNTYGQKS